MPTSQAVLVLVQRLPPPEPLQLRLRLACCCCLACQVRLHAPRQRQLSLIQLVIKLPAQQLLGLQHNTAAHSTSLYIIVNELYMAC
jgi:hypothetical protein